MIVDEKILKRVTEKEKDNSDLKRCIVVRICPRCGSRLDYTLSEHRKLYFCLSRECNFKYQE